MAAPLFFFFTTMNVRTTLSEVVDALTELWEQICLSMAAEPPELREFSNWGNVIDREVSVILEEAGWSREQILDALRECASDAWLADSGLQDMLQCCEV